MGHDVINYTLLFGNFPEVFKRHAFKIQQMSQVDRFS
jgi:hypothetical protein